MRRTAFLILALLSVAVACFSSCGGSSAAPSPSSQPIPIEFLNGATDVAADASFQATFSSDTDMTTVTDTTFFIVEAAASANVASAIKAAADLQLCNPANKVSASVATTGFVAVLTPATNLEGATRYTICVINVKKADGSAVADFSATFITALPESSTGVVIVILDARGGLLATAGSTDVALSPLYILFSEVMNASSVTAPGHIALTCHSNSGDLTPAIAVTQAPTATGTSDRTYLLTVTDAYTYQLLGCTLTLTANLVTAAGATIGTAPSYAFTAGCALMDDFRSNTQACWTVPPPSFVGTTWSSWAELNANGIAIPGNSSLTYAPPAGTASYVTIIKTVTFTESGFSFSVDINVPAAGILQANEWMGLSLVNVASPNTDYVFVGLGGNDGVQYCQAMFNSSVDGTVSAHAPCPPAAEAYSVSVTVDTTSGMTASYRAGSGATVQLTPDAGSFPTAANVQDKILQYGEEDSYLSLSFHNVSSAPQALVTRVQTSGISSETQY